ncbi:solute carrier family 28 member 3-like [Phymastichus coffea]|uniref:solute carrier family 28 member 3-like n=1 Tax=Phymastichus coffea TaxID=108790 RepID=UPI00273B1129|nr:solute carrier family 28 member 3-like [Phymastichus coffea]
MDTKRKSAADDEKAQRYKNNTRIVAGLLYICEDKTDLNDNLTEINEENMVQRFTKQHHIAIYLFCLAVLHLLAWIFFISATIFWLTDKGNDEIEWCNGYGILVLIYFFTYGSILYRSVLKSLFLKPLYRLLHCHRSWRKYSFTGEIALCSAIVFAIVIFLIIDTSDSRSRLVGCCGVFLMLAIGCIFSNHPTEINWRTITWGLIIQFIFGLLSIRWPFGRSVFQCLSLKIATFLDFAKDGAIFMFSDDLVRRDNFAFTVLPVLFFFSFVVKILYYLGIMQRIIKTVGWILHAVMGTTVCESIHAATTLFLGMPESFLVIEPYLNKLTGSEMHAIMCSCFATTSGTVMAAYISFGAQPVHLITATVMSAPAGLCFAKLLYPEREESSTHFKNIVLKKSEEKSLLDAATKGALSAIPLVLGIVANIVVFVSAVAFLNSVLAWLGTLVGYPELTFELILAKTFIPLSYVMGVPWEECEAVGTLIGLKTIVNEFVAYQKLGQFKSEGRLRTKAEAIATYAICGFANPSSLGIMISSLSTMAPNKRKDILGSVFRAFIGGCAVCFLTASIAGILTDEETFESHGPLFQYVSLKH